MIEEDDSFDYSNFLTSKKLPKNIDQKILKKLIKKHNIRQVIIDLISDSSGEFTFLAEDYMSLMAQQLKLKELRYEYGDEECDLFDETIDKIAHQIAKYIVDKI